jgi:hypothetical protein
MLLVPVTPHRVEYKVATQRPYFELDWLILKAVGLENLKTIEQLETEFRVPRRVLIECLIGLFEDGWIALPYGSRGLFALTMRSRKWLHSGKKSLESVVPPQSRSAKLVQELVTGAVLRRDDVYLVSRYELEQRGYLSNAHFISKEVLDEQPDEGRVRALLRCREGEWIYSIDNIEPSGGPLYLPIDYSVENKKLVGLPRSWHFRLSPFLLDLVRTYPGVINGSRFWDTEPAGGSAETTHSALVLPRDLIRGTEEVRQWVKQKVRSASHGSSLMILLGEVNAIDLYGWKDDIVASLRRGAKFELIWGGVEGGEEGVRILTDILTSIEHEAAPSILANSAFRWNRSAAAVHTDILIETYKGSQPSDLRVEIGFGPPEWLKNSLSSSSRVPSSFLITIRSPGLAAQLCRSVASALSPISNQQITNSAHRWRFAAMELEKAHHFIEVEREEFPGEASSAELRIVGKRDVKEVLGVLLSEPSDRCTIAVARNEGLLRELASLRLALDLSLPVDVISHTDGSPDLVGVSIHRDSTCACGVGVSGALLVVGSILEPSKANPKSEYVLDVGLLARCESWARQVRNFLRTSISSKDA